MLTPTRQMRMDVAEKNVMRNKNINHRYSQSSKSSSSSVSESCIVFEDVMGSFPLLEAECLK